MAKITKLPALKTINGFKGILDYYLWMGIPCVRTWPRSPGKKRAPAVQQQWAPFTHATQLWPLLSPDVRRAYITMASGSGLTGRDLSIRAYIKGLYRYSPGDPSP